MILYHAITVYHILKFVVHKLRFHPEDDAILLYPDFLVRSFKGIKQTSVFSKCIIFNWEKNYENVNSNYIFKEIEHELSKKTDGYKIEDFSEINVCRSAYYFGSFLVSKNILFQWFEEADGRLSQPEPIMEDDSRIFPKRYEMAFNNGLYTGNNSCVLKKYIKMSAQLPGFYDPLAVDFDVMKEMNMLSDKDKNRLLDFFNVPRDLTFKPHSAIVLTAHFCNLRVMTYEEHALCYQLTSDYFLNGYKLYFKVHPSDLMPYQSFMDDVEIIPAHFPSELLTLVYDKPFDIGASVSSTGIYNISPLYKKVLIFNQEYIKTFWYNHHYYFCARLTEEFPGYRLCGINLNQKQLKNMMVFGISEENRAIDFFDSLQDVVCSSASTLYFIGSMKELDEEELQGFLDKRKSTDVIVFLNENNTYPCYELMKKETFTVKELRLRSNEQEDFKQLESRMDIIIFTDDAENKRKVEAMKFTKKLLQTGAELNVLSNLDKDVHIAALKGMLKATEYRVEQYKRQLDAKKDQKKL